MKWIYDVIYEFDLENTSGYQEEDQQMIENNEFRQIVLIASPTSFLRWLDIDRELSEGIAIIELLE